MSTTGKLQQTVGSLTSVAYIESKSITERQAIGRLKIGSEVAHVTRDLDTTFKVKRSKEKVTRLLLLTAVLARQAAAAVGVGT